jgi:DNA-binding CsgD family transcriptional regulator
MKALVAHLDRLTRATSVEEVWTLHSAQMAKLGFGRMFYGFTRAFTAGTLGSPKDTVVLTTHSPDYMRVYFNEGLYQHAPMIKWARANVGAHSWRYMTDPVLYAALSRDEQRVVDFNRAMNVTAGYTISFPSAVQRFKGAVALIADIGLTQDDVDAIWAEDGEMISAVNNVMHLKIISLPHDVGRPLTQRQREVLHWVGEGKSVQDTAQLLKLTPATVEKHLRLAREALDVTTTAQAVMKATLHNQMWLMDGTPATIDG